MQEIYNAEDRAHAERAIEAFARTYGAKFPKAVAKITDDRDELLAFYDFPAERWIHLRTTNPIESTFSAVKLRTKATRGAGSPAAALAMVFKLVESAQTRWRAITGAHLVPLVRAGARFENGILAERSECRVKDTLLALEALTDRDPNRRDVAAEVLGDLLRGVALDADSTRLVVGRLVSLAVNEPVTKVRESALNSISESFNHHSLPLGIVQPLAAAMPTMEPELLAHTPYIFGATHDPQARPLIEPFLNHPDTDVREEAGRAAAEITASTTEAATTTLDYCSQRVRELEQLVAPSDQTVEELAPKAAQFSERIPTDPVTRHTRPTAFAPITYLFSKCTIKRRPPPRPANPRVVITFEASFESDDKSQAGHCSLTSPKHHLVDAELHIYPIYQSAFGASAGYRRSSG